jgi:glycerophosphoryl diester phosphodiesterase
LCRSGRHHAPGVRLVAGRVVAAASAQLWAAQSVPPLLSSFQPDALKGAQEAAEALPRALLLESLAPGWLDTARALGCRAVVTHHRLMDAEVIGSLRGAGLRALVYTVNEAVDARRLLAIGIDGLITDAVDRFAPALQNVA